MIVYPYKTTPGDFELRMSLRSLVNVEHEGVIIAGDVPQGLRNVTIAPVSSEGTRYARSTANILAAAKLTDSATITVMHDDIFLLRPWAFRHENRGTMEEYLASGGASGEYRQHVIETMDILAAHGVKDPLWFGLHTPTVYDRGALVDLIEDFDGQRYLLRTLYHNLHPQPSERREDVKVRGWSRPAADMDVLSISDSCARSVAFRRWIADRFPRKSVYEV